MGTILRHKYVTTRKPHICFGCGREFKPPVKMISAASADGGRAQSYYLCDTCEHLIHKGGDIEPRKYKCAFELVSFYKSPEYCRNYKRREEKKEPTEVNTDE